MKKILILANSSKGVYSFRNEVVKRILEEYELTVSVPEDVCKKELEDEGCKVVITPINRRGVNPIQDMKLMFSYRKLIKDEKPDVVMTYTIKPNVYGGMVCQQLKVPYIETITGLGSTFQKDNITKKIVIALYKIGLKKAECVFFQNKTNMEIFEKYNIRGKNKKLVNGSGVSLDKFTYAEYPDRNEDITITYVGRIMKEKGMDELIHAARCIKEKYENVRFELVGDYEDDYKDIVEKNERDGILKLTSYQKNIKQFYERSSAIVMPSYHEGMSNVILEASATGRPILASNIPGCKEGFEEGITGFGFEAKNAEALTDAIEKFLSLSYEARKEMGQNARKMMEQTFDRKKVVASYIEEINKITKR